MDSQLQLEGIYGKLLYKYREVLKDGQKQRSCHR